MNKKLIYIHVPKTGGSTLQGVINRNLGRSKSKNVRNNRIALELYNLPPEEIDRIDVLKGHMGFGHHELFAPRSKVTYVTLLRDPIPRMISFYYYILTLENHYAHNLIKENNYSLREFIELAQVKETENLQVRFLSGNTEAPYGTCTRAMLEVAKQHIDKHIAVTGITEFFDESTLFMQDALKWRFPYYSRANVTGHGVKPKDLDDETLEVIKKNNQLDIELYEYALEKMKSRIEQAGEPFQKRLKRYKRVNRYFEKVARIKRKIVG